LTRSVRLYLEDLANAVREIEEFMKDQPFNEFADSTRTICDFSIAP